MNKGWARCCALALLAALPVSCEGQMLHVGSELNGDGGSDGGAPFVAGRASQGGSESAGSGVGAALGFGGGAGRVGLGGGAGRVGLGGGAGRVGLGGAGGRSGFGGSVDAAGAPGAGFGGETAGCGCSKGVYCEFDGPCHSFECTLAQEACTPVTCEGGPPCNVQSGPVTGLPASQLRGICFDNSDLFVVDAGTSRVMRYVWPDLQLISSFPIQNGLPGDCAVVADTFYYTDARWNSITRVDLASGSIQPSIAAPALHPRSLAADEEGFWVSCDETPQIFLVNLTGSVIRSIPNKVTTNACDGMAATPTGLWCLDLAQMALWKLSKQNGTVVAGPFFSAARQGLTIIGGVLYGTSDGFVYDPQGHLSGPPERINGIAPYILQNVEL
ncbi:MAG: hypothetical protein ACOY0T_41235 [Myxococcota bacterium]